MEAVVIALLVSTLATTGLVALAAALSRGHWFLRTAAFLAVIAPLLAIPAYEPFVTLALQGATIAAGVHLARRCKQRRLAKERAGSSPTPAGAATDSATPALPRFRIATLLWATVLLGIAAAVAARFPALNRAAWQSIFAVGIGGGLAVLLGRFAATRRGWRKATGLLAACALGLALSLALMQLDWFAVSILHGDGWPPDAATYTPTRFISDAAEGISPFFLWFWTLGTVWPASLPLIVAVVAIVVWLLGLAASTVLRRSLRAATGLAAVLAMAYVAALPVKVLFKMLTPLPIPQVVLPEPNAYDELVAAGGMTTGTLPNSGNYDETTASRDEVAKAAAQVLPAVSRFRLALDGESRVPLDYRSPYSINLNAIQQFRSLARGLSAVGKLAELDGDVDSALATYLDTIRLGVASPRGGMLVDGLVGSAIKNIGVARVFRIRDRLSPEQCRKAIAAIRDALQQEETYEALEHRDLVWTQHAMGWHGRLHRVIGEVAGEAVPGQYRSTFDRNQAMVELLLGHLALRAYRAEHGAWPEDWSQVEAAGLPPLAVDPLDPDGGPLRYRREGNFYVLYSVGYNEVDDGGAPPSKDEGSLADNFWTGDLLLEREYTQ